MFHIHHLFVQALGGGGLPRVRRPLPVRDPLRAPALLSLLHHNSSTNVNIVIIIIGIINHEQITSNMHKHITIKTRPLAVRDPLGAPAFVRPKPLMLTCRPLPQGESGAPRSFRCTTLKAQLHFTCSTFYHVALYIMVIDITVVRAPRAHDRMLGRARKRPGSLPSVFSGAAPSKSSDEKRGRSFSHRLVASHP